MPIKRLVIPNPYRTVGPEYKKKRIENTWNNLRKKIFWIFTSLKEVKNWFINNIIIKESDFRENQFHCGVLILQGNKTFGKAKKGKMFYKCIPYEKELPIFLIPYELRIGFNKNHINKYVMFSFDHWEDKHPIGILKETFGNVDNFSSFCSYQLWCKNLVYSNAQFQRQGIDLKYVHKISFKESILGFSFVLEH